MTVQFFTFCNIDPFSAKRQTRLHLTGCRLPSTNPSTTTVHHKQVCSTNQALLFITGTYFEGSLRQRCFLREHCPEEMHQTRGLMIVTNSSASSCLIHLSLMNSGAPEYLLLTKYVKYQRTWRTVPRGKIDLACLTSVSYIVTLLTNNTGSLQIPVPKQQEWTLRTHKFSVSC